MAVELGSAFISVGLSTKGLGGDIKKAFGGADSAASTEGKRAGGGFKAGFVGALAGAVGALGIGSFLKGAVSEASGLGESVNALNVMYGKASAGVQKLGKESAKSLGLSNLEFNNLAVRFSSFAKTITGPGGNVTGTLDDMTTRASDFASVMNLEVSQAAELFQSGLAGESEPLRAFGIDMSAAAVEAFALKEGIATSASEMTEAQKVQARYGLLMQQTAATAGDFANTSGSLANQQRILSSSWKNTQASLGALFLPTLEKVVGFINASVMPNIDKLVASLGSGGLSGAFAPIMSVVGPVFSQLAASFGPLIPQVVQLASSFSPLGLLFRVLTPILPQLSVAFTQIAGSIAGVLAIVIPLASQLVAQLVPVIVNLVSTVLPPLASMFGELVAAVAPFVVSLASNLIPVVKALMPVVMTVFSVVSSVVKSAMQVVQGVIQVVTGIISGNWSKVWTGIQNVFSGIWNTIKAVVSGAIRVVGSYISAGLGLASGTVRSTLGNIASFFSSTWNNVVNGVSGMIGRVTGFFGGLLGRITGAIGNAGTALLQTGKDIVQGLIDGIGSMMGSIGRAVISIVPEAIRGPFEKLLGINSPSKVFRGYGVNIGQGLILGIDDMQAGISSAVEGMVTPPSVPTFRAGAYSPAGSVTAGSGSPQITINQVDDPIGTAHAVARRLGSLAV